jgi:hypothetical protein
MTTVLAVVFVIVIVAIGLRIGLWAMNWKPPSKRDPQ